MLQLSVFTAAAYDRSDGDDCVMMWNDGEQRSMCWEHPVN